MGPLPLPPSPSFASWVASCMGKLAPRSERLLVLRVLQARPVEELAAHLGIRRSAAEVLVLRAAHELAAACGRPCPAPEGEGELERAEVLTAWIDAPEGTQPPSDPLGELLRAMRDAAPSVLQALDERASREARSSAARPWVWVRWGLLALLLAFVAWHLLGPRPPRSEPRPGRPPATRSP